jgi:hypothetical protein
MESMPPKRENKSRRKKDSLRFILINQKSSGRLRFSSRLFHPERVGSVRSLRTKAPPLEDHQPNLSFSRRFVAAMVAVIFICAGVAMIVLGLQDEKWIVAILGPFAAWYGLAWLRVAYEGRLPGGRLRLNPWNRW